MNQCVGNEWVTYQNLYFRVFHIARCKLFPDKHIHACIDLPIHAFLLKFTFSCDVLSLYCFCSWYRYGRQLCNWTLFFYSKIYFFMLKIFIYLFMLKIFIKLNSKRCLCINIATKTVFWNWTHVHTCLIYIYVCLHMER